jgi:bacteriorhodopsin
MESQLIYSQSQWDLVLASFVFAFFALLAAFVYQLSSRRELSSKYRPAGSAGAMVTMVAAIAYLVLITAWVSGFDFQQATDTYVPSDSAFQFRNGYRYVDWSVTVPLLTAELAGVSLLAGQRLKNTRAAWMVLAWLMIVLGYLGEGIFGRSTAGLFWWGIASTVVFIPLYVWVLREGFRSARLLGHPAGTHLRNAAFVLSFTWGVYPLAYLVPFFAADSSHWAVARQLAFTAADVVAKVGYGFLIHATAKARTATDVAHGESPHPEAVYINSEKVAEAQPVAPAARSHGEFGPPHSNGAGEPVGATGSDLRDDA